MSSAGDFDIPSSREDVDRDSSWNQWLRSNLPQLFMEAMDVFSVRNLRVFSVPLWLPNLICPCHLRLNDHKELN